MRSQETPGVSLRETCGDAAEGRRWGAMDEQTASDYAALERLLSPATHEADHVAYVHTGSVYPVLRLPFPPLLPQHAP